MTKREERYTELLTSVHHLSNAISLTDDKEEKKEILRMINKINVIVRKIDTKVMFGE